jgi:hypothetical protein
MVFRRNRFRSEGNTDHRTPDVVEEVKLGALAYYVPDTDIPEAIFGRGYPHRIQQVRVAVDINRESIVAGSLQRDNGT